MNSGEKGKSERQKGGKKKKTDPMRLLAPYGDWSWAVKWIILMVRFMAVVVRLPLIILPVLDVRSITWTALVQRAWHIGALAGEIGLAAEMIKMLFINLYQRPEKDCSTLPRGDYAGLRYI